MSDPFRVPAGLAERRRLGEDWARWLDRLPRTTTDLLTEWKLTPDGAAMHGHTALVLPVRPVDGEPAVLKVGFDGAPEMAHEHLVLQRWGGDGAVRLLRADPRRRALLLERIGPDDLGERWDLEACEVVAGLYPRLHVPPLPQLRPLAGYVHRWAEQLAALPRDAPVPHRLVEQAVGLAADLTGEDAAPPVVLHGDLHYANVLAAEREPWLVIDPQPISGDAHYEPAPMLWNRWEELAGDVRGGVRRRFHTLVDVAGLDEDRARDWVVVRMMFNVSWAIADAERAPGGLTATDREWITRCVAVAKAVQD